MKQIRIPEIASVSGRFSFILFSFLHVVSSRFFKRKSFLGTDFHFWSWLGLTRKGNVKSCIKSHSYFAYVPLITEDPTSWAQPYPYLPTPIQPLHLPPLLTPNWFVPGCSWSCFDRKWHYMTVVSGRFFWVWLGTKSFLFGYPRNKKRQKSFPLSQRWGLCKVLIIRK